MKFYLFPMTPLHLLALSTPSFQPSVNNHIPLRIPGFTLWVPGGVRETSRVGLAEMCSALPGSTGVQGPRGSPSSEMA